MILKSLTEEQMDKKIKLSLSEALKVRKQIKVQIKPTPFTLYWLPFTWWSQVSFFIII